MARSPRKSEINGTAGASRPITQAIGSSGLKHSGGFITEEFLRELHGPRAAVTYRMMALNDPIVGAIVFAVSTLLRQTPWSVTAVDDSAEAEGAKTFVEEVLFKDMSTPFANVIDEVTSMIVYGYAPMEVVWKWRRSGGEGLAESVFTDGKLGIAAISLRSQMSVSQWEIDPTTGAILGLWQQPYAGPRVFIPIDRLALFRTTAARSNPEGASMLRTAYRPWFFKSKNQEFEAIGMERDLAGLPMVRVPGHIMSDDASAEDRAQAAAWLNLVKNIRRDQQEGIMIPSDVDAKGNRLYDVSLLSTGGSRAFDTNKVIERYNREIATSVLADFIFLGQGSTGSFALSSDKTKLFGTAIGALNDAIAATLNDLIKWLWYYNALDEALRPTLKPGDIEKADIAKLAEFVSKLAAAGAPMFPDRDLENHLRDQAGLPAAPEEGTELRTPELPDIADADETEDVAGQ